MTAELAVAVTPVVAVCSLIAAAMAIALAYFALVDEVMSLTVSEAAADAAMAVVV